MSNSFRIRRRLNSLICGLLVLAATAFYAPAQQAHYLGAGRPDPAAILPPPPLPASAEQVVDMRAVQAVHAACTTNESTMAFSEKKFSVFNFSPAIGAFFQPGKLPKTEAFFER